MYTKNLHFYRQHIMMVVEFKIYEQHENELEWNKIKNNTKNEKLTSNRLLKLF